MSVRPNAVARRCRTRHIVGRDAGLGSRCKTSCCQVGWRASNPTCWPTYRVASKPSSRSRPMVTASGCLRALWMLRQPSVKTAARTKGPSMSPDIGITVVAVVVAQRAASERQGCPTETFERARSIPNSIDTIARRIRRRRARNDPRRRLDGRRPAAAAIGPAAGLSASRQSSTARRAYCRMPERQRCSRPQSPPQAGMPKTESDQDVGKWMAPRAVVRFAYATNALDAAPRQRPAFETLALFLASAAPRRGF